MPRGGPSRTPYRAQSKDHNAKQAQARKERKANQAAGGPSSIHDVFEYVTNQQEEDKKKGSGSRSAKRQDRVSKRAQVNDLDDQRAFAGASTKRAKAGPEDDDDDSEEDGDDDTLRQTAPNWRRLGEGSDDEGGVVRSEDDEEIDSDEAFGESDEEKFEGWKFGSSSRAAKKGTRTSIGDNEGDEGSEDGDEDDDEEDEDEGMMDLSKLLDGASESGEDSDVSSEDDDRLREKMESIGARVGDKRQAESDSDGGNDDGRDMAPNAKRRLLKERSEAVQEGQWNAPRNATGTPLLTIDDLMDPLKEQSGTAFTSLRNTARALKSKGESKQAVASKKGGGVLQAPLPSILQDRIDRSAAYDETKQEVQGWQPTIKRIREAEHLSFPLQPDAPIKPSTSLMTSQFQPANSFERDIAAMLEKEGLSDKKIAEMEELKTNERGMSAEEIQERRNDLRRMRDLIFREEQKAKRVSKIKSKTYRKIARKQRERDEEKAKAAGIVLEDAGDEDEELEKAARQRAKERATLKHKNTGKWAKNTLSMQGAKDMPEARNAIEEQLRKGEQLRRRIQGQNSEDEGSSDEDDDDDEGESGDEKNAFDELRAVQRKNEEERQRDEEDMQGKKGVWGMKFMKDARDRKARQTQEEADNFEREMEQLERSDRDSNEEDDAAEIADSRATGAAPGRMVFNTASTSQRNDDVTEGEQGKKGRDATIAAPESRSIVVDDVRSEREADASANPWMSAKPTTKLSRKKNESVVSKEGSSIDKAANKIQKHIARGDEERRQAEEDAQLDIDPESRLKLQGSRSSVKKNDKGKRGAASSQDHKGEPRGSSDNDDDDVSSDDEPVAIRGKGPAAIQQRDLVAEAFAGDDVMADFAAEKQALIEADAPQTIDTTLPGWGSWGGKGVRANKKKQEELKKKFAKVVPGLDPSTRKDANMTNVIINQKKDKKADKYRGKDVPYPYTSRAQYEMAMRNPLGPEWNTRTQHQKLTLPRVVTKPGKAIKPIERLF